jgi:hypothetical protein
MAGDRLLQGTDRQENPGCVRSVFFGHFGILIHGKSLGMEERQDKA